jgi:hypothetical protein
MTLNSSAAPGRARRTRCAQNVRKVKHTGDCTPETGAAVQAASGELSNPVTWRPKWAACSEALRFRAQFDRPSRSLRRSLRSPQLVDDGLSGRRRPRETSFGDAPKKVNGGLSGRHARSLSVEGVLSWFVLVRSHLYNPDYWHVPYHRRIPHDHRTPSSRHNRKL